MTPETLATCAGAALANAQIYAEHLTDNMQRFGITTAPRQACLIATVAIESDRLRRVEENLYYSTAARLRAVYPSLFGSKGKYRAEDYLRDPVKLSMLRYQGYHGRGLIQLTWMENYLAATDALGVNFVARPYLVQEPEHASSTACWFFAAYKKCLPDADRGDMYSITNKINGPARLQFAERKAQMLVAFKVLGVNV